MAVNEVKRTKAEAKEALIQRRADAQARADNAMAVLRAAADTRHHQAALAALDRMVLFGRMLKLEDLTELVAPQVWIVDGDGRIVGHVLTVDATDLDALAGAHTVVLAPLGDALQLRWLTTDAQATWGGLYAQALRRVADQAHAHADAIRSAARLERTLGGKIDGA